MDKREQIAKALLALVGIADNAPLVLHGYFSELVDALAEQAIVIECEVEHKRRLKTYHEAELWTELWIKENRWSGHRGTPGKAIAIILPSGNDEDTQQS